MLHWFVAGFLCHQLGVEYGIEVVTAGLLLWFCCVLMWVAHMDKRIKTVIINFQDDILWYNLLT